MNSRLLSSLWLAVFTVIAFADEVVWNKDHDLNLWKAKANAVSVYADGVLKISEIGRDHQLISPVIQLDPAQYNAVSITYRVKEIGRSRGQLFFAGPDGKFNGKNFWGIPPLIADFEWHTITLGEKNLRDPESWAQCGTVTRLRLDPYDAAGGYLEISEIKFFRQKSQPAAKRKPIPRYQGVLDEPEWPKLVSEYQTFAPPVLYGSYFQGGMLRSPLDGKSAVKSFKVLRRIDCKSKPTAAYLQFTADDGARAFINGECVGQSSNWRQVTRAAVDKHLEPGCNVWAFEYSNAGGAGGVLGELFVQYEDGSVGLAAKKTGKATNIFCGAYQFDMPFLLELLKKSGVHIYTESTDIVETNTHLLMLHARFGGKKEITLPHRTTVLDVYGRKIIGKDIDSFSFEAPLHSTSLFYFGDDAEVLLEKLKRDL